MRTRYMRMRYMRLRYTKMRPTWHITALFPWRWGYQSIAAASYPPPRPPQRPFPSQIAINQSIRPFPPIITPSPTPASSHAPIHAAPPSNPSTTLPISITEGPPPHPHPYRPPSPLSPPSSPRAQPPSQASPPDRAGATAKLRLAPHWRAERCRLRASCVPARRSKARHGKADARYERFSARERGEISEL